jgi:hypothetical protein
VKLNSWVVAAALLISCTRASFSQSIGLYSDDSCASCNVSLNTGETSQIWVSIRAGGQAPNPETIIGGAFRVSGIPSDWTVVGMSMPYVFAPGDPRERVQFGILNPQTQLCFPVYVIMLTAMSSQSDVVLSVEAAVPPSNPSLNCPYIVPCDGAPCDAFLCVAGGDLFVNSETTCSVSTAAAAWTHVKTLYQ